MIDEIKDLMRRAYLEGVSDAKSGNEETDDQGSVERTEQLYTTLKKSGDISGRIQEQE